MKGSIQRLIFYARPPLAGAAVLVAMGITTMGKPTIPRTADYRDLCIETLATEKIRLEELVVHLKADRDSYREIAQRAQSLLRTAARNPDDFEGLIADARDLMGDASRALVDEMVADLAQREAA